MNLNIAICIPKYQINKNRYLVKLNASYWKYYWFYDYGIGYFTRN